MPHKSPADRRRYAREYHRRNREARKAHKQASAQRLKARNPEAVRRKWREEKATQRIILALEAIRRAPKTKKRLGYSGALRPNGF
jgi:uncharacterized protein YdiU (UPF0061 family)